MKKKRPTNPTLLTGPQQLELFRDTVACAMTNGLSLHAAIAKARDKLSHVLGPYGLDKAEQDVTDNPPQPLGA